MKLKYYGTAAAEGVPGLFCTCETCEKSRKAGGRNLRSRSQALVDGSLLIDFPPDTMMHVLCYGLNLFDIRNIVITHSHNDHLLASDFAQRRVTFAYLKEEQPLHLYGFEPAFHKIRDALGDMVQQNRWAFHVLTSFQTVPIGSHFVTPLKANHDPNTQPHFFQVSDGNQTLLYAHDTGYFPQETWAYFESSKPFYQMVSLDCTLIHSESREHHMGLTACAAVRERMLSMGLADDKTIWVLQHFSHNGGATYDELVPIAKSRGFEVAYDTMEVKF